VVNETDSNVEQMVIRESDKGRFSQEITIGEHKIIADEPIAKGGDNLGPSPYDFLLAALGSCTSMTIRMYAQLHKIPLSHVIVKLYHEKTHADDSANYHDSHSKIDHIERKIELQGNLSNEHCETLLSIAEKCPVYRTLKSEIKITTHLIV
jgi:putative redox protein